MTKKKQCFLTALGLSALLLVSLRVSADVVATLPSSDELNGSVSVVSDGSGSMTVTFPEQLLASMPRYNAVTIVASTSTGEAAFSGNYIQAGVQSVLFHVQSHSNVSEPVDIMLVLRSSVTGRTWRNENVTASRVDGELVVNQVSFDRSSGWTRDGGGDLDAMWTEDLQGVEVIGVRLTQPAREGMSYTVSAFTISGTTFTSSPATLTALENALQDKFGVISLDALTDAQKAADSDGDGMTDLEAVLSENDETYANSIFMAEIIGVTDAGILIKWPCVVGSHYTVIRADNLMSPFEDLAGAISLPADKTGFMTYLDVSAVGDGPYFYKIRREP